MRGLCVSHPSSAKHKHTCPANLIHTISQLSCARSAHTHTSLLLLSSFFCIPPVIFPLFSAYSSSSTSSSLLQSSGSKYLTALAHIIFFHFLCLAPHAPYAHSSFLPLFLTASLTVSVPLSLWDVTLSTDVGASASMLGQNG